MCKYGRRYELTVWIICSINVWDGNNKLWEKKYVILPDLKEEKFWPKTESSYRTIW